MKKLTMKYIAGTRIRSAEIIFNNEREERFFFRATRGLLKVEAMVIIASVIFLQT